jgi:cardiolipin synthase (CMP-forming)
MNLPNVITIFRILLIPVFIILLLYNHFHWALAVFAFSGVTDGLDGFIARKSNQRTVLGAYLDPMADKLLLIAGFVTLSFLKIIPLWMTIVLVSRDLILIFGTLILHMIQGYLEISPSWLGKCTTVTQMIYILAVLFVMVFDQGSAILFPLLFLTLMLTVVSGLHYIFRAIWFLNAHAEHSSRP